MTTLNWAAQRPTEMGSQFFRAASSFPRNSRPPVFSLRRLRTAPRYAPQVPVKGIRLVVRRLGPQARDVRFRVIEGDGDRVVGEGNATLSDDGGWEATWNVPDKARSGHYEIHCKIGPEEYAGFAAIDIEEYRVPLFSVIVEADHEIGTKAHARVSSASF